MTVQDSVGNPGQKPEKQAVSGCEDIDSPFKIERAEDSDRILTVPVPVQHLGEFGLNGCAPNSRRLNPQSFGELANFIDDSL